MPKKKKSVRPSWPPIPSKFFRVLAVSSAPGSSVSSVPDSVLSCVGADASSTLVEMNRVRPSSPKVLGSMLELCQDIVPLTSFDLVEVLDKSVKLPEARISSEIAVPVSENSSIGTVELEQGCEITSATAPELEISSSVPVDTLINSSFDRITNPSPTSSKGPLWMTPSTFLEDGTPMVVAPASVLLKTAEMSLWEHYGSSVLEDGGVDFHSFSKYSPMGESPLEPQELQTAQTWAILKNVPPQLYSLEGISVIASGIGEPLHTEKSRLGPVNIGRTKVKVVTNLGTPLPDSIVVRDVQGNTARVAVTYPRPPPKCLNCGRYGHLLSRCSKPLMKKLPFKKDLPSGSKEVQILVISLPTSQEAQRGIMLESSIEDQKTTTTQAKSKCRRSRSKKRSASLPSASIGPLEIQKGVKEGKSDRLAAVAKPKWIVKADVKRPGTASQPTLSSPTIIDASCEL
ncbi:Zinc knuckle (CCHC-type) family protein [Arabidopsis thaliana]|uniref:Zinc knuckle (CCHC-type) family protein n=1 Tax=Arabidopsis thaliana TaxID=3702 RepID=F4KFU0_ARATH|nr:Zinc knuckle (CCHC-type) family protein [Arabidopsis thaliana]AED93887.1 Zinc knuckle (CCHC-type) family protein [Arabidopsis thaliana]|eukprot:NP_680290.1 Zinc knuckle (CCHC-type) family protein [Arabidopsis thaliana]